MFKLKNYRYIQRCIEVEQVFDQGWLNKVWSEKLDNEYHVFTGNKYGYERILVLKNGKPTYFNPHKYNPATSKVQNIIRQLYNVKKFEKKE